MTSDTSQLNSGDAASRDDRLADAIERYMSAAESGTVGSVEAFAAQFPDISDDLAACLESLDFIGGSLGAGPATSVLEPGTQFGDYFLRREIARGGMGVVYEAFHEGLERRVALKVLSGRHFEDESHRQRFLREAKTAAGLHHTNIVPVFEVGECGEIYYYAMQFIEGESLGRMLRELRAREKSPSQAPAAGSKSASGSSATIPVFTDRGRPAATSGAAAKCVVSAALAGGPRSDAYFREAARLIAEAADAVAHAHRHAVVHRDIKPFNLLVDGEGRVWVTDFGLAFRPEEAGASANEPVGTPAYMSPEQVKPNSEVNYRTDIYSLGATLYELLTLAPMFKGDGTLAILTQIVSREPRRPFEINPRIPLDLDAIVRRATAKLPEERYRDAESFAADLRRFIRHEPVAVRPIGPVGRLARWCRREPRLAGLTAASMVAIVAVTAWFNVAVMHERDSAVVARKSAELDRDRATVAESASRDNLWDALYQQARATRLSTQTGRRLGTLDLIARAGEIRRDARLRDEAIAALAATDARLRSRLDAGDAIELLAFCLDGSQIVCVCKNGTIKRWNLGAGAEPVVEPAVLATGVQNAQAIALSACGRYFAAATRDGALDVWDASTGELLDSLEIELSRSRFLAFLADPLRLVTAGDGGACLQWRIEAGVLRDRPTLQLGRSTSLARGPDGNSLTQLRPGGELFVWDLESGESHELKDSPLREGRFARMMWDPRGRVLASSQKPGVVDLWELNHSRPVETLGGHRGFIGAMEFNATATMLAANGSFDPTVRLWDVASGDLLASLVEPQSGTRTVAFTPDGRLLATGGSDKTIWLWEIVTPGAMRRLAGHDDVAHCVAISPDGRRVAAGAEDGAVLMWTLGEEAPPQRLAARVEERLNVFMPRGCMGLTFSSDGKLLAARFRNGSIQVWSCESGEVVGRLESSRSFSSAAPQFVPDRNELLRAADRAIERWEVGMRGSQMTMATATDRITAMATTPDATRVAVLTGAFTAQPRPRIEIFDVPRGDLADKPIGTPVGEPIKLTSSARTLAISADGQVVAVGDSVGNVQVHSVPSGEAIRSWHESDDSIAGLDFSPRGDMLAVAGRDGVVRLRRLPGGELLARLPGHSGGVRSVSFSRDGVLLATCGDDKLVHVWKLPSLELELASLGLAWELPATP